jgi:hypothetical protein
MMFLRQKMEVERDIILVHLALRRGRAQRESWGRNFGFANELSRQQVVKQSMTDHYFNTLEYARQLGAAGVPEAQAEVHANALGHVLEKCLSTAGETAELRAEISASEARLEAKIAAILAEKAAALRIEIAGVEAGLHAELQLLRAEIKRVRLMNGVIIALSIAILAQGYFR